MIRGRLEVKEAQSARGIYTLSALCQVQRLWLHDKSLLLMKDHSFRCYNEVSSVVEESRQVMSVGFAFLTSLLTCRHCLYIETTWR